MNSIQLHIPALLKKVQEMSDDHMAFVTLTMTDEVIDQSVYYPAFLHFEACTGGAAVTDYESVDAVNFLENQLLQDNAV